MSKYPTIWIPSRVIPSKSKHKAACVPSPVAGRNNCHKRPQVFTDLPISDSQKQVLIDYIKNQWGLPPIKRFINAQFLFYVSEYPDTRTFDLSNWYQFIEDVIQVPQWKKDRKTGVPYFNSGGAGIIENDSLIHSHNGSDFRYLCPECEWGKTGTRKKSTKKIKRCPKKAARGAFKAVQCPYEGTKLIITDYTLTRMSEDEINKIFFKNDPGGW